MLAEPTDVAAYVWTTGDWLSFWQLLFTILGFGLAIVQLWRTANATVASRKLLASRLLGNDLLAMLPELHSLEDAFDVAVRSAEPERVEASLVSYFRAAGRIQGYLEVNDRTKDEIIIKYIKQSITATRAAKIELGAPLTRSLQDIVAAPRAKIVKVTQEATALVARLQRETN